MQGTPAKSTHADDAIVEVVTVVEHTDAQSHCVLLLKPLWSLETPKASSQNLTWSHSPSMNLQSRDGVAIVVDLAAVAVVVSAKSVAVGAVVVVSTEPVAVDDVVARIETGDEVCGVLQPCPEQLVIRMSPQFQNFSPPLPFVFGSLTAAAQSPNPFESHASTLPPKLD